LHKAAITHSRQQPEDPAAIRKTRSRPAKGTSQQQTKLGTLSTPAYHHYG